MDRQGGEREQAGDGRGRREHAEHDTQERDTERPAATPPQRKAADRPAGGVDDQLRAAQWMDGVVCALDQDEYAERDRDEEPDGVDEPVAGRTGTDPVQQRWIELCRQ